MKRVLLHICCANCSTVCCARLRLRGFKVSGYFFNPNIHPYEEYVRRMADVKKISLEYDFSLIPSEYKPDEWLSRVKGLESEREGGRRCMLCFQLRLSETYRTAREMGFDYFTTTLTISPHKKSPVINQIGRILSESMFLAEDFKKKDGYKESVCVSKTLGLYRQVYCGCMFSNRSV